MRRIFLFVAILISSLIALAVVVAVGVALFSSSPWSWYGMGGMMGGGGMGGNGGTAQTFAPYFWVVFVVLIGFAVVGVVGLAYHLAVPEIRVGAAPVVCETPPKGNFVTQKNVSVQEQKTQEQLVTEQKTEPACTPLESIVKTLSEDERKVIEVLAVHDGKYLQKYIRNEVGLSRLQTHRIVARLAERGIVTLEKTGNTNNVVLADWLKK
jgi:uncharacterized membrane protein